MRKRVQFLFMLVLLTVGAFLFFDAPATDSTSAAAQGFSSASKVTVSVRSGYDRITDQTRIPVRVRFQIKDRWHIQAHDVEKEDLIPTRIDAAGPESARVIRQVYPEPDTMELPGFGEIKMFEKTTDAAVLVSIPDASLPAPGESLTLTLSARVQACDDKSCLAPGTIEKTVSIERTKNSATKTPVFDWLRQKLGDDFRSIEAGRDPADGPDKPSDDQSVTEAYKTTPPNEVVTQLGLQIGNTEKGQFAQNLGDSLLWALLVAFGWGLMASLSPCVYPMIPLTLSYFGMQASGEDGGKTERRRVILLALVYVLGIALTFALLGVVVALIGVELGFALGSPWFVGFLIALLVGMGLSLMGFFEIPMPSGLQQMAGNKPGVIGAFSMGAFLGVIAAPCVGPFAAAILAFIAGAGDLLIGFAGMFSFGIGLGMLFLVLAIFGESFSSLSAGGGYLEHVKAFWGFVLIGASLYFVDLLFGLINRPGLQNWGTYLLAGLLLIWFGVWLYRVFSGDSAPDRPAYAYAGKFLALASLAFGVYLSGVELRQGLLPEQTIRAVDRSDRATIHWQHDFVQGIRTAKEKGKPVLIDFYADWCIPCKQMDRTVLSDSQVAGTVNEKFVPIKLDVTDGASWNSKLKTEVFQTHAMPYYAFFSPSGRFLQTLSIKGKVPRDEFLDRLRQVQDEIAGKSTF